jgi:predicted GNAT family acetyltransferase/tellurite resistance protein
MEIDFSSLIVVNNVEVPRFEAQVEGYIAVIDYYMYENKIVFTHTGVPEAIAGHGVGSKMARTALDHAKKEELKVVPICPFVAAFIDRHPEYQDLIDNSGTIMSDKEFMMKLAKVIIAIAWADGEISNDEINCLKDLLFQLPKIGYKQGLQLNGQEWARLEMYIETPVDAAERARLVADLQDALDSPERKQLAHDALRNMVESDGLVSDDEKTVVAEIDLALSSDETGFFGGLQRLLGGAMERRSEAVAGAPNREAYYDDFLKNKVYYSVSQRLRIDQAELDLSDDELRILGLVGGLMAKIAQIDREVTDEEFEGMVKAMQSHWQISPEAAAFVAEVAVSAIDVTYDIYRMMRELVTWTTEEERRQLLVVLFEVAAADGQISIDETEEIRLISRGSNLSHKDFINAKLEVMDRQP